MLSQEALLGMWYCQLQYKSVARLNCLACGKFEACDQITPEYVAELQASPFVDTTSNSKLIPRRVKMYLFLTYDGELQDAYPGFDVDNPDWERLQQVKEVLYVGKAYQKQMKLVVKNKDERDKIKRTVVAAAPAPVETPEPKKATRKNAKKAK